MINWLIKNILLNVMIEIAPTKKLRQIRSYVCREGRLTPGQAKALASFGDYYVLTLAEEMLDFKKIYGNDHPVILEIGFGMGHSLLEQAKLNPELNYLGIEVHRPGVGALLSGMAQESLQNIRIINHDAVLALNLIREKSLQGVQIFFPDPWHKKRHHKRRLIQLPFVQKLAEKIKSGGYLHCATDWEDYAHQMLQVINKSGLFELAAFVPRPETRPVTKFERRGIKLGHGIWDIKTLNTPTLLAD